VHLVDLKLIYRLLVFQEPLFIIQSILHPDVGYNMSLQSFDHQIAYDEYFKFRSTMDFFECANLPISFMICVEFALWQLFPDSESKAIYCSF
jgi:hypothetical protein